MPIKGVWRGGEDERRRWWRSEDRSGERVGESRESVLLEFLTPCELRRSYKGSSSAASCCYRCFSNAAPRCTPALYSPPPHPFPPTPLVATLTRQHPVIYQQMPKDNPDTRFPIPMLRNDTSAQHHRSSFTDFVDNAFQCDFSPLPPARRHVSRAFIVTFLADILDILNVYRLVDVHPLRTIIYNEKTAFFYFCKLQIQIIPTCASRLEKKSPLICSKKWKKEVTQLRENNSSVYNAIKRRLTK